MELLRMALDTSVIIIANSGPYGNPEYYTEKYVPKRMREKYECIPTDDVRKILKWKKDEILLSRNKKCAWRINLPPDRDEEKPLLGMSYAYRAMSSKETIIKAAISLEKTNQSLFVIFINSGQRTEGKEPVADKFESPRGNYSLDVDVEASETGDSIVLNDIEIIPHGRTLNYFEYVLYDPENKYKQPRAFHLGRGYPLSLVQKGRAYNDSYRYKDEKKYAKMEIVGVGKLTSPWCGKTKGDRTQKRVGEW